MLEVEVKYRVPSFGPVLERLQHWQAEVAESRDETDTYFNAPHRDFAQTDEAFRIRRIGSRNFVTYKGPRRDLATKTRTEVEVPLGDGDRAAEDFQRLIQELGFRPTATVRKRRQALAITRGGYHVEICLDDVERVGTFVEIEIVAEDAELDRARAAVLQVAGELGLTDSERRSYLELLLDVLEKK